MAGNPAFVSACMSIVSAHASDLGWHLEKSILTRSDVWGLVWRVDFVAREHPEGLREVNRVICWGTADGQVLGTATVFGKRPL